MILILFFQVQHRVPLHDDEHVDRFGVLPSSWYALNYHLKVGASCHFLASLDASLDYPDLDYFLELTGSGLNNQPIPPETVKIKTKLVLDYN